MHISKSRILSSGMVTVSVPGETHNLAPIHVMALPPSDLFHASGRPKMLSHSRATVIPNDAWDRVPLAMNTGSSTYICMRMPRLATMADVLRHANAANLPHTVGALADPKTKTLKTKNLPWKDAAVNRHSSGCNGT